MSRTTVLLAAAAMLVSPGMVAHAHPGGLDPNGCHHLTDSGPNHCHRVVTADPSVQAAARKSRENVCHGATLPNYTTIECSIGLESMAACLKSGGRAVGS